MEFHVKGKFFIENNTKHSKRPTIFKKHMKLYIIDRKISIDLEVKKFNTTSRHQRGTFQVMSGK